MKRISTITLAVIALSSFVANNVCGQSPHFLKCSASGVNADGSLQACFKIAGLGSNQQLTVTASADATAVWGCLNHGGQCPNSKVTSTGTVTASGTFTSGQNGQITGCLGVEPPSPPAGFGCPNGQRLVLVSVTYTNVSVSAPGAGSCDTSPGTFSANFYPQCP
jgi:hypothetical protein